MINWTTDERTTALMKQAVRHFNEFDELSIKLEVQMDAIREEYLTDLWFDFRSEDSDAFEEWHNQPTVEEFVDAALNSVPVQEPVQCLETPMTESTPPKAKKDKDAKKPVNNTSAIGGDCKTRHMIEDAFFGSKKLCAAILATGKTHGPMTPAQMTAAIEYAHNVVIVDKMVKRVKNRPPRTLRLVDWNYSKLP